MRPFTFSIALGLGVPGSRTTLVELRRYVSDRVHSMVRRKRYPHRLRLASTGLLMPRARQDARAASPQREPQRIPRSQASTSEVPGTDQSRGLDGYTCRNRPSFSSSLHGCGRCIRPKDEKDKAPLSSRSCGRSLASLYNGRRPHFALDRRTPDQAYYASRPLCVAA